MQHATSPSAGLRSFEEQQHDTRLKRGRPPEVLEPERWAVFRTRQASCVAFRSAIGSFPNHRVSSNIAAPVIRGLYLLASECDMTTNDQIVLGRVLQQRQEELDPDAEASTFFEFFTAEQILKDYDLSYEEVDSGLVGHGGDGGVDSLYLLVNGDLVQADYDYSQLRRNVTIDLIIIQSKTHAGFEETPVERFRSVSADLFDLSADISNLPQVYNERLVESIQRFHELYTHLAGSLPALNITFCNATKASEQPHPSVLHKVTLLENEVKQYFPACQFGFKFLGATQLLELARTPAKSTYHLSLAESPMSSSGEVGFVCLVRLHEFFKFIVDDSEVLRRQIFEANVRDYQGPTEVNDEIQASLRHAAAEDFWWLNNGVSILASDASLGAKTLTIQDPQIVNGLQTSRELYEYCKASDLAADDPRNILVRVMVPSQEESRDRIIKATNSQTSIQPSSLRATEKIHRDIEDHLKSKGLFYDRRKNYYKNQGKPRKKIVSIPYLAQAVMAIFLRRPDSARARPSSLLKANDTYQQVFNNQYPISLYYVCAEAMFRIESFLKAPVLSVAAKDRLNLRYYVAMHAITGVGPTSPISNTVALYNVESLSQDLVQASVNVVYPQYIELGGNDQVAKGPVLLRQLLS